MYSSINWQYLKLKIIKYTQFQFYFDWWNQQCRRTFICMLQINWFLFIFIMRPMNERLGFIIIFCSAEKREEIHPSVILLNNIACHTFVGNWESLARHFSHYSWRLSQWTLFFLRMDGKTQHKDAIDVPNETALRPGRQRTWNTEKSCVIYVVRVRSVFMVFARSGQDAKSIVKQGRPDVTRK